MYRRYVLLSILFSLTVCLASKAPAQPLYFDAKVTSGPISKSIAGFYSKFVKKDGYTSTRWSVVGVSDFNRDGIPDVLYHTVSSGYRGAYSDRLTLEKGVLNGRSLSWKEWYAGTPPPGANAAIGDLNSDGWDDIAFSCGDRENNDARIAVFQDDEPSVTRILANGYGYVFYFLSPFLGDFDGNGFLDIYQSENVFLYNEPSVYDCISGKTGIHYDYYVKDRYYISVADVNRDRCDDFLYWQYGEIHVCYGDTNRAKIFSVSDVYDAPIQATGFHTVSISDVKAPAAYVTSATEFLWVSADLDGSLAVKPLRIDDRFNPANVTAADVNRDESFDLLSWNENRLSVYLGESDGVFQHATDIDLPYVREIKSAFVRDADLDGQNDLLVFSEDGDMITLYRRDAPPPTPTPTQTPFPPTPIQPTPTPVAPMADDIIVDSTMALEGLISNAPDGAVFYLEPGSHMTYATASYRKIESKKLSLIGIEPIRLARIMPLIKCLASEIRLQNLSFDHLESGTGLTFGDSFTYLIVSNSTLEMTNCFVRSAIAYSSFTQGGQRFPDPTLYVINCIDRTLTLKDNEIEAGDSGVNILVENCQDTTLDLRENPMLGINNRIAHVQIVDSTNVTVLLREVDNPYYPRSLTTLTVSRSTVNVIGGVVRGVDGLPDVVGEDGGYGIRANEGSTVTLQNVGVAGGRGGDGIEPGRNGPATLVDETSAVLWESAVGGWELH